MKLLVNNLTTSRPRMRGVARHRRRTQVGGQGCFHRAFNKLKERHSYVRKQAEVQHPGCAGVTDYASEPQLQRGLKVWLGSVRATTMRLLGRSLTPRRSASANARA